MTTVTILFILALVFGFYAAWNIGANDVANAVGTSVGSGALTLAQAVIVAAIFEFAGAYLFGSHVSETVEAGIVRTSLFAGDPSDYVFGMLASLLAAGVWLQTASFFGWPVSTTHSIVGAVVGFGLALGGIHAIYWGKIGSIAASWVISPLLGGILAYYCFSLIRRRILYRSNPVRSAKKLTPFLVFFMFAILMVIILPLPIGYTFLISLCIALFCAALASVLVRRIQTPPTPVLHNVQAEIALRKAQKHLRRAEAALLGDTQKEAHDLLKGVDQLSDEVCVGEKRFESSEYDTVERIFVYLQIITACFMAFAHGSNDVANAIGPLSAIVNVLQGHEIASAKSVPTWLLLMGGAGIVFGLATWGWRVIETVGRKITHLTPSRGFAAGLGAALTIVLASKLGLPISTTHVLVGAVLGVGFARGIGAINLNTIRDIVISWVITVPAGALLSVIFFFILRAIFVSL